MALRTQAAALGSQRLGLGLEQLLLLDRGVEARQLGGNPSGVTRSRPKPSDAVTGGKILPL